MTRFVSTAGIAISLLFASTLAYNGIGHSLHWLALAGIILLAWLSRSIAKLDLLHTRLAWGWLPAIALAYAAWLLVNPFVSTYPYASSTTAMQLALLPLVLLGWLISHEEDTEEAWRNTWILLLFIGIALSIWGGVDFVVLHERSHGPLIDANAYGALINLLLIPAAFGYLNTSSRERGVNNPWIRLSIIGLLALALCMSLSRGALLSLLAILPLLFWYHRRSPTFRRRAPLLLLVLASAYMVTKTVPRGVDKGIETLVQSPVQRLERDSNIQARFLMWKGTWAIIKNEANPLVGTGLGTYKNYYATYRDTRELRSSGNLAHNDYLQALQEGGLAHLALLFTLTVLSPVFLLYKHMRRAREGERTNALDESAGLMLGILAVSLHALVNFTHYVSAIALLSGLYLARGWERLQPRRGMRLLPFGPEHIKPGFVKGMAIALVAVPVTVLAIDGVIFKLFSTDDPWIKHLTPQQSFAATNAALAIRPGNPKPRVYLIQNLLDAAGRTAGQMREQTLTQAETEAKALIATAPALASGRFFLGKTRILRGTRDDLLMARSDLESAVERVPPAMGMRLELVKLYERLGLKKEALETIRDAKEWFMHEIDYAALAAFANEASSIASAQQDQQEAEFWEWVHSRLEEQGFAS